MARIGDYFIFDDSSLIIWRDGSANDPYVDKSDTLRIVNNRAVLDEIPDKYSGVKIYDITGYPPDTDWSVIDLNTLPTMIEVDTRIYNAPKTPNIDQYIVNYANGVITFHPDMNGKNRLAVYKGRGKILIAASRIWITHNNPYAVDNLQEFVDLATLKIQQVNIAIGEANQARDYANEAGNFAIEKGNYAELQADKIELFIGESELLYDDLIYVRDQTIDVANQALDAKNQCLDAYNRSILKWQNSVETYDELILNYPSPELGYTVMVNSSGVVYRWDGANWNAIGNMVLSTPLASESVDGLLSRNDFVKLKEVESGAQVNFQGEDAKNVLPDYFKTKTIVFVVPSVIDVGTQGIIIQFPYNGIIKSVSASVDVEGTDATEIQIQKISADDFKNKLTWTDILTKTLFIDYGEKVDDKLSTINEDYINVSVNDLFRINVVKAGIGIENLCVEILVQI